MGKRSGDVRRRRSYRLNRDQVLDHLETRLELIASACAAYDELRFRQALNLAIGLRVLLHDGGRSASILSQLDTKNAMLFEDTCGPISPSLVMTSGALAVPSTNPEWGDWVPLYERRTPGPPELFDRTPKAFDRWWSEPVIEDGAKRAFSRRKFVLGLANQDGGGHVDPDLDEDYAAISRENSLGWQHTSSPFPDSPGTPFSSPVLACVRQVAHEVVRSCQWWLPDVLRSINVDDDRIAEVLAPIADYRTPARLAEWDPDWLEQAPAVG